MTTEQIRRLRRDKYIAVVIERERRAKAKADRDRLIREGIILPSWKERLFAMMEDELL